MGHELSIQTTRFQLDEDNRESSSMMLEDASFLLTAPALKCGVLVF